MIPGDDKGGLRIPPHSEEAERGVLGSILLDPHNSMHKTRETGLQAESFYDRRHQALYDALHKMSISNMPMDALTIAQWLADHNELDRVGGYDYLAILQDATLVPAHVGFYSGIVAEKKRMRLIIELGSKYIDEAYKGEDESNTLMQGMSSEMVKLMSHRKAESNQDVLDKWYAKMEAIKRGEITNGLPLPWAEVDKMFTGLSTGLHVVGARPSTGKTTYAMNVADFMARQGIPVLWNSLDMGIEQTLVRSVIRESRVSLPRLQYGHARWNQVETVKNAKDLIATWPIHFTMERSLQGMLSDARMMKLKHDVQLLIIDHLTLMHVEGYRGDRRTEVGRITSALKGLAFDLDIPVMLLSQLSRGSAKEERPPRLDDLRESGDIEQDATTVMLLSKARAQDYEDFIPPAKGEEVESPLPKDAERSFLRGIVFDMAKNQQGQQCGTEMWMRPNYFRFEQADASWCDLNARLSEFGAETKADEMTDVAGGVVTDTDDEEVEMEE